jgi:hypothetical protein
VLSSATATGGAGGASDDYKFSGSGGAGGAANVTSAATSGGSASVTSTASATGGAGGEGLSGVAAGAGGNASATSAATSSGSGVVTSSANATGGAGGASATSKGVGGKASATSNVSTNGGYGQATASANGGFGSTAGSASAQAAVSGATTGFAQAKSATSGPGGSVTTTALSPVGGPASASTFASIGSGGTTLIPISAGQTVSNATLTSGGGFGAMSVGYGGTGETLTYDAEADFNFATSSSEKFYLTLFSNDSSGSGFDSLELKIVVDGNSSLTYETQSLDSAEAFFTDNSLLLGVLGEGNQTVDVSYMLTASVVGDGFGFDFGVGGAVPEASTWAMMLAGFAGLGFATFRRSRKAEILIGAA